MKRYSDVKEFNNKSHYIFTQPRSKDEVINDFFNETEYDWREKSRRLQARRWRKIRNQLI